MRADRLALAERASVAAALVGAALVLWGFCVDGARATAGGTLLAVVAAWGLVFAALRRPS